VIKTATFENKTENKRKRKETTKNQPLNPKVK
jgi:hypothetical protein